MAGHEIDRHENARHFDLALLSCSRSLLRFDTDILKLHFSNRICIQIIYNNIQFTLLL